MSSETVSYEVLRRVSRSPVVMLRGCWSDVGMSKSEVGWSGGWVEYLGGVRSDHSNVKYDLSFVLHISQTYIR